MIHNDVLRSVRYMLDISDGKVADITALGGLEISKADVISYTKKDEEEGFVHCPDAVLAHFLDGLVIYRRGRDESRPAQAVELPVTNNIVLKKLRVAFELKEDDMHAVLKSVDFPVSKPELSALFRKFGHNNYRACGDQLLRNFLKGLTLRVRG
ncbi:hypothetical protein AHFPHNDE_03045 [Pseudomonas sp. MM227]|uniref:DUF1456 family protein n=1 Tax=Pseudomonas baltica TaxID=2762576 RepID=A0A7X1G598_9PSED|nr:MULTISPECIES: DUF1456 family protein [Pseudomonas]MBC2678723.1 DUF1456 family protein [Pseudomonas baltica]MBD8604754.1 DUF1456 family protein [Pseudomonas sp. CFBP 8771]MBD8622857.1 DUF1456 family protein [Pseudomonas sp. CFBP 13727]CAI3789349.1 hypothetical protein AHFPHNDE_03045 [Pseudomonas sp. MM227]